MKFVLIVEQWSKDWPPDRQ